MRADFVNYLSTIISAAELSLIHRRTAAVLLKSLLEKNIAIVDQPFFQYTKLRLITLLQEAPPELAAIVSNSIVTIVGLKDFSIWPDILKLLDALIKSGRSESIENAVFCLEKLCEDIKLMYKMKLEDFENLIPHLVEVASTLLYSAIQNIFFF